MKYFVEITETLQRVVEIEADSKEEAYNTVSGMYFSDEIELNVDDNVGLNIEVL